MDLPKKSGREEKRSMLNLEESMRCRKHRRIYWSYFLCLLSPPACFSGSHETGLDLINTDRSLIIFQSFPDIFRGRFF